MRFYCNNIDCEYFSDRYFEPDKFTLLTLSAPGVKKDDLDEIEAFGKLSSPNSEATQYALAAIKCPACELMFFMPAKKALKQGLEIRSEQKLPDWDL